MVAEYKFYLTPRGLEQVKKEYDILRRVRLQKTAGEVPQILHSEEPDPEYLALQEDLNLIETRLGELEDVIKNVKLIEVPQKDQRQIVALGATVSVEIDGENKDEFTIVGSLEANPALGKISCASPVGRALLGKKAGDEIILSSPIKTTYKIKKIMYHLD